MRFQDCVGQLSVLGRAELAKFMALLLLEITVRACTTYEVGGTSLAAPGRMRQFNEVEHRLAGFLLRLLLGEELDVPLLQESFREQAEAPDIGTDFQDATEWAAGILHRSSAGGS